MPVARACSCRVEQHPVPTIHLPAKVETAMRSLSSMCANALFHLLPALA